MQRWLWLLLLASCAPVRPVVTRHVVPSELFDFGGVRATVRHFPGDSICEAEPRFLLDEVSSVNGLLRRFLEDVPGGGDAEWTELAMARAAEGAERLPRLLGVHGRTLDAAGRCAFATTGAWPSLLTRGRGLIEQTRARLEAAPGEVRAVRQARALAAWRAERLAQQDSARRACPPRPRGAVIYFAWREGPLTTWLFCDGAQVTREGAGRPRVEAPPAELGRARATEAAYQAAVGRFPAGAVVAPPVEAASR
ncbi:MAG: hypothetical protein Q8L48_29855 [Archangium sp.]|nr:hypothetical protein [Archangium sp.]